MNTKTVKTICLFFLICQVFYSKNIPPTKNSKPNIIYILADDLGIGDLTLYNENGKIPTPNLDKLGMEGMKFTDAHTSSSVCTPTRYGILTGRYSWRTPLKEFVTWGNSPMLIKEDRLTVADILREHGYTTANIGKWHLGLNWSMKNNSPDFHCFSNRTDRVDINKIDFSKKLKAGALDLGFEYSYMLPGSLNMPPFVYLENDKATMVPTKKTERKRKEYPYSSWIKGVVSDDFKHEQVLPTFINKTVSYIEENVDKEKPFFIYLPLPSPHSPVLPIAPWKGKSGVNEYADFVMMVDELVGNVLKSVKNHGIEENTLIVFTSDNGCASTANLPLLKRKNHSPSYVYSGFKGSYLEGGHRVPFLVKWPEKVESNSVCNATICTTDFMATVADLMNYSLKDNEGEDSYSMMPLLMKKGSFKRDVTIHHDKYGVFAIRKGDWKLVMSPNKGLDAAGKPSKKSKGLPDVLLYNLVKDIKEKNNIADLNPEKVKELKNLLLKQINDGRSTRGVKQQNDFITSLWPQAMFAF